MTDEQVYIYAWLQVESWHPYPVRVTIYRGEDIALLSFMIPPSEGDRIGMHNWIAPPESHIVLKDLVPKVDVEPDIEHAVRSMRMPGIRDDRYMLRIFVDHPGDVDEMLGE